MKQKLQIAAVHALALVLLIPSAMSVGKDCGPPPGTGDPFALHLSRSSEGSRIGYAGTGGATKPPAVGHWNDDDGDTVRGPGDVADIVVVIQGSSSLQQCLAVFDGRTAQEIYRSCRPEGTSWDVDVLGPPAMGDINQDGTAEVVVPVFNRNQGIWVEAFAPISAEPVWVSPLTQEEPYLEANPYILCPLAALADLEGDGRVEIILGQTVIDGRTGGVRWCRAGWPLRSPQTVAVDLDVDGVQEVVNGATALAADGTILWAHADLMNSSVAVGNLDDDPFPEIVVNHAPDLAGVGLGGVTLLNHDGSVRWQREEADLTVVFPGGPAVGDLDGDGESEIVHGQQVNPPGVGVWSLVRALSRTGSILWEYTTTARSGSPVHPTLYDMDGDGDYEVLVIEEDGLTVLDGETGAVLSDETLRFPTVLEYPVVADLEGDGQTEVVVLGSEPGGLAQPEILIYTNPAWGETRSVWNQWSYMPEHIAEDGRVLYPVTPGWLTHNTFRAQVRELNEPPVADAGPDLIVECASWEGTPVMLDASRSWDPDDDPLVFEWTGPFPEGGGQVEGERVEVTLPLGVWEVTLLVSDPCVQVADTLFVTVRDTTPPMVTPVREDLCLWPPAHRYACWESNEAFEVHDACDQAPALVSVDVRSDQDPLGPGSGHFEPDWVISDDGVSSFCLRAERDGRDRTGRTYAVTLLAVDASGNEGEGLLEVLVPHDREQAVRECALGTVRATIGPEDRFRAPFSGLPDPLPDHRMRRLR